jgi:hypothetical protein
MRTADGCPRSAETLDVRTIREIRVQTACDDDAFGRVSRRRGDSGITQRTLLVYAARGLEQST